MTITNKMKTYWNGESTPARRVMVKVGKTEIPTWWSYGLEGTERKAVEVTYGENIFFLDDEDGDGWLKVTMGRGGPEYGHSSLPSDSEVVREREDV